MKNRILALLLVLCLVFSAVPVYAGAATGQQVTANAVTVTAGNTATVTLKAENFTNIAALDVYVYYDASVFTVSSTSNGDLLSGAQSSVNTAEAGKITLSLMSLNGITGTGNLLTIRFATNASCEAGTYPITVAIGRAYDSSLQAVEVGRTDGSVTVNKPVATEKFEIYGYPSATSLQKGNVLSYRVASASSSRKFVSGEFVVNYDHEVFAFESATLESALTTEGAVYSINSATLGQVRIAYANDEPVSNFYLFTVKLKVIADLDGKTTITAQANNMYREDLSAYLPDDYTSNLTLTKLPVVEDHPNAYLQTDNLVVGQQSQSLFCLEAGAGVAAADFTLTYDPAVLRCVSVDAAEGLADVGGMVVINDNFQNGTIRFSYINMEAYAQKDLPLVQITWEPLQAPAQHYQIALRGAGVVDPAQNAISLEYVTGTGCIYVPTVVPPCVQDGYTQYDCPCGESYKDHIIPMEGHILQDFAAKDPTCTENGWTAHVGCTRCDYKTVEQIPALGHDYVNHPYEAPTCTEIGWESYETCSRCDYTTYRQLEPLGHRCMIKDVVLADPISIDCPGDKPFVYENGIYYSTNHDNSSSAELIITALYDFQLKLVYSVSSEQNYDKLYILHNGIQQDVISGLVTGKEKTFSMTAGDTVTVRYAKDGSVNRNEDRGWVELQYEQVSVETVVDVPCQDIQPTCTEPVVCSYCDTVVKETAKHDLSETSASGPVCSSCGKVFVAAIYENAALKQVYESFDQAYASCGEQQYIQMLWDVESSLQLDKDLYLDLNGRAMTGTIQTGEYTIYGMDSKTNMYENSSGYFACTDAEGKLLQVQTHWATTEQMTGVIRSYLAIQNDRGWSFNRYYLGLTHITLKPATNGVGYKAYFVANSTVCDALSDTDTFGYALSLEGGRSITRAMDGYTSGRVVTLRVDNYNVKDYGEAGLSAKVFMTLKDGTVLESSEHTITLRGLVETINREYSRFDAEKLQAAAAMILANPTMQDWDVENILNYANN